MEKIKKTLVIHPKDKTTDFLKKIYENIPICTVITHGSTKEVKNLIHSHDRIIMLGHGTSSGLLSKGYFRNDSKNSLGYVIDDTCVKLLKEKECISIWCHANVFMERNDIKGFYSGMFVSEVSESIYCGIPTKQKDIDFSNNIFSELLGECMFNELETIYDHIKKSYGRFRHTSRAIFYNHQRLFLQI